jgi:hypothetical protein
MRAMEMMASKQKTGSRLDNLTRLWVEGPRRCPRALVHRINKERTLAVLER